MALKVRIYGDFDLNGVQEAGGSNPLTQTKSPENTAFSGLYFFPLFSVIP